MGKDISRASPCKEVIKKKVENYKYFICNKVFKDILTVPSVQLSSS